MLSRIECFKIRRKLPSLAKPYEFFRNADDGYGGKTNEVSLVCTINGLYHESFSHIRENLTLGAIARQANSVRHKECYILCLPEETTLLQQGDRCVIAGEHYFVHSVSDLSALGLIAEISLRPQDDGTNNQY